MGIWHSSTPLFFPDGITDRIPLDTVRLTPEIIAAARRVKSLFLPSTGPDNSTDLEDADHEPSTILVRAPTRPATELADDTPPSEKSIEATPTPPPPPPRRQTRSAARKKRSEHPTGEPSTRKRNRT